MWAGTSKAARDPAAGQQRMSCACRHPSSALATGRAQLGPARGTHVTAACLAPCRAADLNQAKACGACGEHREARSFPQRSSTLLRNSIVHSMGSRGRAVAAGAAGSAGAPPGGDGSGQQQPVTTVTATARVDVGDAVEVLQVPLAAEGNSLVTVTLTFPMGITLEETTPRTISVVEVAPGSAGAAANVREGDVVRALTAASMQMTYPTLNLMLGGVGRPKLKRIAVPTTGKGFAWVREAIKSNLELGDSVTLVLERAGSAKASQPAAPAAAAATASGGPAAGGSTEGAAASGDRSVFDPRIFE